MCLASGKLRQEDNYNWEIQDQSGQYRSHLKTQAAKQPSSDKTPQWWWRVHEQVLSISEKHNKSMTTMLYPQRQLLPMKQKHVHAMSRWTHDLTSMQYCWQHRAIWTQLKTVWWASKKFPHNPVMYLLRDQICVLFSCFLSTWHKLEFSRKRNLNWETASIRLLWASL